MNLLADAATDAIWNPYLQAGALALVSAFFLWITKSHIPALMRMWKDSMAAQIEACREEKDGMRDIFMEERTADRETREKMTAAIDKLADSIRRQ